MKISRLEAMRLIEWATSLGDEDFETKRYNQDDGATYSLDKGVAKLDESIH